MYIAFIFESRHVIDYINNLSRSPLYIGDLSRYGVNHTCFTRYDDFPRYSPLRAFCKGLHRYKPNLIRKSLSGWAVSYPTRYFAKVTFLVSPQSLNSIFSNYELESNVWFLRILMMCDFDFLLFIFSLNFAILIIPCLVKCSPFSIFFIHSTNKLKFLLFEVLRLYF